MEIMPTRPKLNPHKLSQGANRTLDEEAALLGARFNVAPSKIRACLNRLIETFASDAEVFEDSIADQLIHLPFRALRDTASVIGGEAAAQIFLREDLEKMALRIDVAQQLSDPDLPAYTLLGLARHVDDFCNFQRTNSDILIQTGLPPLYFRQCPWLHTHLGRLYDTRTTISPYLASEFGGEGHYEWQSAHGELCSYDEAGFLNGLSSGDAYRLDSCRAKWFQVRLRVLERLAAALPSPPGLGVTDCLDEVGSGLDPEDLEFLCRMDRGYFGNQFKLGSGGVQDREMAPGGLANLLEVVGRVQMELRFSTFDSLCQWFGDVWPGYDSERLTLHRDRQFFELVKRSSWDRASSAIDDWTASMRAEAAAWESFEEEVKRGLLANCRGTVELSVRNQNAAWLKPILQRVAESYEARGAATELIADGGTRPVFRLVGKSWDISFGGKQVPKGDSVGLRHIAFLLRHPNQTFTGTQLCANERARKGQEFLNRQTDFAVGDYNVANEDSVRRMDKDELNPVFERIDELEEKIKACTYPSEKTGLERERERILTNLKGFTDDDVSNSSARARATFSEKLPRREKNDTDSARKAVKLAMDDLGESIAPLGEHLRDSIQVGVEFAYRPGSPVDWQL